MSFSYTTGGTLELHDKSYVVRQCDEELYHALKQREFCYILTSRQMGKSSLMVRTAKRLKEDQVSVITLDLTITGSGGHVTLPQWYNGLLFQIGEQLMIEEELEEASTHYSSLGDMQRWFTLIQQVVLPRCPQGLVIFIDEIDTVRDLTFSTDEFFAGMRACYTQRSQEPSLQNLTFCLLGVATPSDLIKDSRLTPFNIGRRIVLEDFTLAEAVPLAQGLVTQDLLKRVLFWTNGHPYLTQALCHAITSSTTPSLSLDQHCQNIFLGSRSRDSDKNLQFVTKIVLRYDDPQYDRVPILETYRKIYKSRSPVRDDETHPWINQLLLAGLVKVVNNHLQVRNRIYAQAFNLEWIQSNMPDAELQRQKAAFRRGAIRASGYAAVVIIALVSTGIWIWDSYFREIRTYYPSFVKQYGIPRGQGTELTWTQAQGRAVSYKLSQKGRKNPVYKVEAVRSQTTPSTSPNAKENNDVFTLRHNVGTYFQENSRYGMTPVQEVFWEFVLDRTGQVVYEKAYDAKGKFVWGMLYSPRTSEKSASVQYVDEQGFPRPQPHTQAEFVELNYSSEGYEIETRYFDRQHRPQFGPDNYHQVVKKHDEHGYEVEKSYFDTKEKAILGKESFHKVANKYDERGNQIEWAYFDVEGKPVLYEDGYHKKTVKYDERGNQIEWAHFDIEGKPVLHEDVYHKLTAKYDERGNVIENTYFDVEGKPMLYKDGFHKLTVKYDECGNQIEWTHFDIEGKPMLHKDGYHKLTAKYDERGNVIENTYFDVEGKPMLYKDGFHKLTVKYDERGNQIEWAHFDIEGKPVLHKDGFHKVTGKYDERGNHIESACFDVEGKPMFHKDGFHKSTTKYDERGNQIEKAYFDVEGKPMLHKDGYGYHKVTFKYDERGKRIEAAYFDVEGKPMLHKDGFHKVTFKYDERGKKTEATLFDVKGNIMYTSELIEFIE